MRARRPCVYEIGETGNDFGGNWPGRGADVSRRIGHKSLRVGGFTEWRCAHCYSGSMGHICRLGKRKWPTRRSAGIPESACCRQTAGYPRNGGSAERSWLAAVGWSQEIAAISEGAEIHLTRRRKSTTATGAANSAAGLTVGVPFDRPRRRPRRRARRAIGRAAATTATEAANGAAAAGSLDRARRPRRSDDGERCGTRPSLRALPDATVSPLKLLPLIEPDGLFVPTVG